MSAPLRRAYRAQKLHELFADFGRGFVLYPVAYIVEFEVPDKTRKAGAKVFSSGIKRCQTVCPSRDVKRRLGDLRALPGSRQVEVWFRGTIVVQCTMKASALEFRYVVGHVAGIRP